MLKQTSADGADGEFDWLTVDLADGADGTDGGFNWLTALTVDLIS
jgi:hypothetical protein